MKCIKINLKKNRMETKNEITSKDTQKITLNFQMMLSSYINREVIKIKEIEDGRILFLYDDYFMISNIKTKKQICLIEGNFKREHPRYYDTIFYDFIELKNRDLIIWSRGKIFHYKKSGDNYQIKQVINELEQQHNRTKICQIGYVPMYDLYNVIELENNVLLSCNSIGLKVYNFIDNEYKLIKVIPMFLDVENVIKIKENNFLIVHHVIHTSGDCSPDTSHEFALSLFDWKSNKITKKIFYHQTQRDFLGGTYFRFNYFLLGKDFIYQICDFPYDLEIVERRKKNKDSFSTTYNIYNSIKDNNVLNLKTSFRLLAHFKDNLFFAQDYDSLKICSFENNIFTLVYQFDFNNSNLCILKNYDFIIYGENKIWEEHKREDGSTWRDCIETRYYYSHYKYLPK